MTLTTVKIRKRKDDRRVPRMSAKILADGTARLSSDLIEKNCRYLPSVDISNKIIVLTKCNGIGESLAIWYSNKFAKSPFISLTSSLNQIGVAIEKVAGTYKATLTKSGIEIRLKERIGR